MKSLRLLALAAVCSMTMQAQQLKVGAAVESITPDKLLPISGGTGTPVQPTGKQGELTTRALYLDNGKEKFCIISVDNLGWPAALGDQSRKLIKEIKPENIIIGSTHAHSAPDAYATKGPDGKANADMEYLNWCVQQIAKAAHRAIASAQPAELRINVAEAKEGMAFNYYAPDLYDKRMGVIQAIATGGKSKGKPIATLLNYASHPEILGTKSKLMSPDFCGPLYDRISEKGGGIGIYMNSAQGGMVTADTRIGETPEPQRNGWSECVRIGQLMADEALRIAREATPLQNPELLCKAKSISFPVENQTMLYILKNSLLTFKATNKEGVFYVNTTMNLINIGPAQILTVPGEALPNVGFYVKRHMKTKLPFLFGLTNDAFGYMLAKVDYDSFERYKYISRTTLGEQTAEIYMNEALKLVEESPAAK